MKKISLSSLLIFALSLTVLSACGGGTSGSPSSPQPTTAVRTLSTAVTITFPPTTTLNSYNVTITLPAGVTVKTLLNSSATATDVVKAFGNASNASIDGVYTAAVGTVPAKVKVYVASGAGFAAGDFCQLNVNVAAGYSASAANFNATLDDATGFDNFPTPATGSTVTGMQSLLSVSVK